jgi:DNA-binding response OmpR family regulator
VRSRCVILGKGMSPRCDNLLHFRRLIAARSAYSRKWQKDNGMEPILLIDDDVELCAMLSDYLGRHDYQVTAAHDGKTGLAKALGGSYSIMLLDVMLPGLDGFEVLRRLRAAASPMSVLLLTARGEDVDRIVGLEIGADDYLPKPFNPRELLARIRAILRRSGSAEAPTAAGDFLTVQGLELDTAARVARCGGVQLDLTDIEFGLLQALMRSAGEVVAREQLAESVLGRKFHPFDRSLDMHVSRLRHKLDAADNFGDKVKTIRGIGYQLAVPAPRKLAGDR